MTRRLIVSGRHTTNWNTIWSIWGTIWGDKCDILRHKLDATTNSASAEEHSIISIMYIIKSVSAFQVASIVLFLVF
jgi:hypothetical protein